MKFSAILWLVLISLRVFGQSQPGTAAPFENEIQAFEKTDSTSLPPQHPIVFTGSSSIRMWENLAGTFPDKRVLNRGFGGSQLSDVIRYADRIIVAYQPRQVVLYAGENDIATGNVSGQQTYERFVTLFEHVRQKLPNALFSFISIKPSPSRRKFFAEVDVANRLIRQFLAKQKNTQFIDVRPIMLGTNGQPIPALFKPDSLHMLPAGYKRWTKVVGPYLK